MQQGFVLCRRPSHVIRGDVFRLAEIDRVRRNVKAVGRLVVTSGSNDARVHHVHRQYDREGWVPAFFRGKFVVGIRNKAVFSIEQDDVNAIDGHFWQHIVNGQGINQCVIFRDFVLVIRVIDETRYIGCVAND